MLKKSPIAISIACFLLMMSMSCLAERGSAWVRDLTFEADSFESLQEKEMRHVEGLPDELLPAARSSSPGASAPYWRLEHPLPDADDLYGVWGISAREVIAVGKSGTILRRSGATWKKMDSPTVFTMTVSHGRRCTILPEATSLEDCGAVPGRMSLP